MIIKEIHLPMAHSIFEDTGIQFTTEGRRYLGAIGSFDFVKSYVSNKVKEWSDELSRLSEIGLSHMQLILPSLMGFWGDGFFIQSVAQYW